MAALRPFVRQRRIRRVIPGHAIVMRTPPPPRDDESRRPELTLCVELPECRKYFVTGRFRVPPGKHPWHGRVLPVTVDLDDREQVRIDWDRVPARRAESVRERIAAGGGAAALDEILREQG